MASTNFQDYNQNTPIVAAWLNDINNGIYSPGGVAKTATLVPVAWVRFSIAAGVVTVQQSINVASVVRTGAGVYTVTYNNPLTNAANCYEITSNIAGFCFAGVETNQSVVVNVANTSDVPTDPGSCSVVIYGAN